MQNLPIKFPNKKGILELAPTLLKNMSLSLNKFKLGFCSDTYLPFGQNSRFLLFFFWRSSLIILQCDLPENHGDLGIFSVKKGVLLNPPHVKYIFNLSTNRVKGLVIPKETEPDILGVASNSTS